MDLIGLSTHNFDRERHFNGVPWGYVCGRFGELLGFFGFVLPLGKEL